jgi:ketosteroid isomerase-like protein
MERTAIEDLIARAYRSRNAGNIGAILECFHPDVKFRIAGSSDLQPLTSPQAGHAAFGGLLKVLVDTWDLTGLVMRIVCVEGDRAVVHRTGAITHIPSGKSITTDIVDPLTFADGRIEGFDEYLDTYAVARAAGIV